MNKFIKAAYAVSLSSLLILCSLGSVSAAGTQAIGGVSSPVHASSSSSSSSSASSASSVSSSSASPVSSSASTSSNAASNQTLIVRLSFTGIIPAASTNLQSNQFDVTKTKIGVYNSANALVGEQTVTPAMLGSALQGNTVVMNFANLSWTVGTAYTVKLEDVATIANASSILMGSSSAQTGTGTATTVTCTQSTDPDTNQPVLSSPVVSAVIPCGNNLIITVKDGTGKALPNAVLGITNVGNGNEAQYTTDSNGAILVHQNANHTKYAIRGLNEVNGFYNASTVQYNSNYFESGQNDFYTYVYNQKISDATYNVTINTKLDNVYDGSLLNGQNLGVDVGVVDPSGKLIEDFPVNGSGSYQLFNTLKQNVNYTVKQMNPSSAFNVTFSSSTLKQTSTDATNITVDLKPLYSFIVSERNNGSAGAYKFSIQGISSVNGKTYFGSTQQAFDVIPNMAVTVVDSVTGKQFNININPKWHEYHLYLGENDLYVDGQLYSGEGNVTNPKTLDPTVYVIIVLIAVSGALGFVVYRKRKKDQIKL